MKIIRVEAKLYRKMRKAGVSGADQVAYENDLYVPVQHVKTRFTPKSIYLVDAGSNLRDASCRIMVRRSK